MILLACALPVPIGKANNALQDDELSVALALADVLRAARSEIADQQAYINSQSSSHNELSGDKLIERVSLRLAARGRGALLQSSGETRMGRLIQAQLESIKEIMDESQSTFNRKDVSFKGFVPAVFTRLVNTRFAEKAGAEARIKVTAPLHLVRNRRSRPDSWEQLVFDSRFGQVNWPRGKLYAETTTFEQQVAFRVMVPEYYGQACLACHGDPKGAMDVTGYPMEGVQLDALGGSISIVLFQ
jgi:hypothetical protein